MTRTPLIQAAMNYGALWMVEMDDVNVSPDSTTNKTRFGESARRPILRDARGRLLPGHGGLKKVGDISHRTRNERAFEEELAGLLTPQRFRGTRDAIQYRQMIKLGLRGNSIAVALVVRLFVEDRSHQSL